MHKLIEMDKNGSEKNSQSMCEINEDFYDDDKSQTEEMPLSGSSRFFITLHHDNQVYYIKNIFGNAQIYIHMRLDIIFHLFVVASVAGGTKYNDKKIHSLDSDKNYITDAHSFTDRQKKN